MNIIAVDDEELALEQIMGVLKEVFCNTGIQLLKGFQNHKRAMEYLEKLFAEDGTLDYAFLDIKMRGMRGIEFARHIKEIFPSAKILFVTGYSEFACEAFQLHALGYILKPATKESVEEVLDSLIEDWREKLKKEQIVRVQTFGNFDVFAKGKPVLFERSKSKELFAYLVDRKGAGSTTAQISAILWEDKEYNRNLKNQTQKIISSMMKNIKEAGIEDIIVKKWNYLAIKTEEISCDYYDFLKKDLVAVNSYMGEYMVNYSWAEFTTANLQLLADDMRN
ncbi:MAG: response regulator [Velocimicrobium sp.]